MKASNPGKTVTATVGPNTILTAVSVRDHQFQCDETEKYGGEDQYPDPFDYILAGLASCVAITLRQYADRHQLPLKRAEVQCVYEKLEQPAGGKKDKITKSIKLEGALSPAQRRRLLRAARCPAHMMLDRGIAIESVEVT